MKRASRVVALQLAGFAILAVALTAQDTCPRASGGDAEAGWVAYGADDMPRARARFDAALARCPGDDYARTGLGYVLLRDGDVAGASALWEAVVASQPTNVDALAGLGLAAWRVGDLDTVRARFEAVVELVPDHATAREYLQRVEGSAAATQPTDPADAAWSRGDTELAFELYMTRLGANAEDDTAALRVALMLAWRGQYRESLEMLDDLLARIPTHVDARLARARVRAWSGDLPTARREVLEILSVQPDNAEALEALGLFQAWSGDLEGAIGTYEGLTAIAPQSGVAGRQRAQVLAWSSRYEAATAAYEALLARDPEDVDARLGLAQALAYSQDVEGALSHYDRVLASSPGEIRAWTGKARALGWAGRLVEAEQVAEEAVALDELNAAAWAALGQLYRWQGRNADAKRAFETATSLAPTSAELRDQLRSVNLAFRPETRPSVVFEDDSDGNRMVTTSLAGSWYPSPRLRLGARAYYKHLEQQFGAFTLGRSAEGLSVSGAFQWSPGWTLTGGVGGSESDGGGGATFATGELGIRSPERHDLVGAVTISTVGLDETAVLAERGVRSTQVLLSGRWIPGPAWRVDGTLGVGEYRGTQRNGRRSASLSASRRVGQFILGGSARGFSFEKNLSDGYFDPDFYGLVELDAYWLYRTGGWIILLEVGPGVQRVASDADPGASLRSNARVAYAFAPARELALSLGYSSAGLATFASGGSDYRYTSASLSSSWAF